MKVTVLGCAGSFPNAASACSSYLVEHDGFALLLDMGNGALGALQRYAGLLAPDAVFLSHLHADHVVDLVAYSYARRFHPDGPPPALTIHGPNGTSDRLHEIAGSEGRANRGAAAFDGVYDFAAPTTSGTTAIGPFEVTLAPAAHPVETYSIRLAAGDRTVVYSGDSGPTDQLVANALGADLFLCEATWADGGSHPPGLHMTAHEAGEHAQRAMARRLWLVHTTPYTTPETQLEHARAAYDGEVAIPGAGTTYTV
ncbi:MAG: hypothetical protein QOG49_674 [Frankiaceae bacterium]|nr:hypothetical protein [Frankiaceae bacterium]